MVLFPNAKINIGLFVTSRRSDGYHNIETVFYPIGLREVLEVVESDELAFQTSGLEIPGYANENLCLRAYELLKKDFELPFVKIHLHKNIPIGAGLGGGSADAAFFLRLMNEKFDLGLSVGDLQSYASRLGADCAFFLHNRPMFASGTGDQLQELSLDLSSYFIVLVMPDVHVSTGEAYRGVVPKQPVRPLLDMISLPVTEWKNLIVNDFEKSVFAAHPEIRGVKRELYDAGAIFASMSGSGASVFGIFREKVALPGLELKNRVFYGV